jgi:hypothetical protein
MRIDQPRIFGGMRDSNNQLGIANSVLISTGSEILWSSVNAAPGTIGGSIAANQVAYGSGSDAIQGSNNLTFDGTLFGLTGNLSVSGITTLQSTTIHLGVSSFASYIRDSRNQQGSPGQVLSATTTGVAWTTAGANYNNGFLNQPFSAVISTTVTHNFGSYPVVDVLDINNKVIVPEEITHNSVNDFIVVFETISTGVIIASNAAPVGIITGTVTGNLNATGFVTSVGFFGPGTNLTNLNASNLDTGTVPSARLTGTYSGITSLGVLTQLRVTGFVTSTGFFGPGTNLTNLNASNLDTGTVPSARLTGNYSGITSVGVLNQLQVTGFVTSTGFFGPGTNLTNLNASALDTGTVPSARLTGTYSGITSLGVLTQLRVTGFVTSTGFFGPGTNLTNLNASNLDTGTVPSARLTGNYSGITAVGVLTQLQVTGFVTSTGFFGPGTNLTNLNASNLDTGTVPSARLAGTYSGITAVGVLTQLQVTGFITSVGFFGPGTNLTNLNASNLDTGTVPSARLTGTYSGITSLGLLTQLRVTGFVTSTGFFGPGTNLTNLNASALDTGTVPSARLTGNYSGITAVGVLTQLQVTGFVTSTGFFGPGTNLTNLNASTLDTGTVPSARLTGTYSGITSVGTLSNLKVSAGGNEFSFSVSTSYFTLNTINLEFNSVGGGNVQFNSETFFNNNIYGSDAQFSNIQAADTIGAITGFFGPGTNLTNLNASNLDTGTVPSARLTGTYSGITSVGILTQLRVAGFITSAGFFGPGTNLTNLNASNLDTGTVPSARLTGTYSGITSLGVLTQLRVTGASTFTGQVFDSENRAGLAGSVLSSTGAGISWINPTSSLLTGIVSAAIGSTSILPTDTILQGIQKAQGHFNLFNTSVGAARYRNYTHDFDHNTRYFTSATDGSAIIDQIGLASHPGILTITIGTSTAFPQTRFAWGGPSGTYKPFMIDDFTRITWVFRYNLYASNEGWFGIYGISCFNSENQNNTICAFFNNTSLFLRAQSSTGVITQINTGVTLTANAWYKMDLVRNSANSVSLIVNDSTMTTLSTTTMPFGTSCGVGGRMMTTQLTPSLATARSFDLDYLQMIFEPLGSRF